MDAYWRIFAEEVPSDLGVTLTPEQVDQLTVALEGAHENYGLATGRDVADRNWRANEDERLRMEGANKIFAYIEERVQAIDSGPSKCFEYMSHEQRMAMHEIFQVRQQLRRR